MKASLPPRVCIMGHSGAGKSPLAKLFKVDGWEPFRVRKPRNKEDAKVCKSPEEYAVLETKYQNEKPLYESPPSSPNHLRVYKDWSFFKVRGAKQCLPHTEAARDPEAALRIEIFGPVLLEMIKAGDVLRPAIALNLSNLFIILLNPTSVSFARMESPSPELRLATALAIMERKRSSGDMPNLADALRRAEHLDGELYAWREFISSFSGNTLECMRWAHFEYCYSNGEAQEQTKAKSSLFKAIEMQWPIHASSLIKRLETIMY